jgi:hypothetical protein
MNRGSTQCGSTRCSLNCLGCNTRWFTKKGLKTGVHPELSLHIVSSVTPEWLSSVQASYDADPHATVLISKLSLKANSIPNYTYKDGLLRYKSRIWIGQQTELQSQMIQVLHNSAVGGHSCAPVTYRRLKNIFCMEGYEETGS